MINFIEVKVLISNDDGIFAAGLWRLVEEVKRVAEVVVVAPDREQSGVGTSVTLHYPLRLKKITPPVGGIECYSVEGTPADSIILGLRFLFKDNISAVVAGINEGANLGDDIFISGTVGAAFQGYFYGKPSIAISVAALENIHFDTAARFASLLVREILNGYLPSPLLLNVNLPNIPASEIRGVEITRLGRRTYRDVVSEGFNGKRKYYWIVRGKPEWERKPGTDINAILEGKISVTPLGFRSNPLLKRKLGEILPRLLNELKSLPS